MEQRHDGEDREYGALSDMVLSPRTPPSADAEVVVVLANPGASASSAFPPRR